MPLPQPRPRSREGTPKPINPVDLPPGLQIVPIVIGGGPYIGPPGKPPTYPAPSRTLPGLRPHRPPKRGGLPPGTVPPPVVVIPPIPTPTPYVVPEVLGSEPPIPLEGEAPSVAEAWQGLRELFLPPSQVNPYRVYWESPTAMYLDPATGQPIPISEAVPFRAPIEGTAFEVPPPPPALEGPASLGGLRALFGAVADVLTPISLLLTPGQLSDSPVTVAPPGSGPVTFPGAIQPVGLEQGALVDVPTDYGLIPDTVTITGTPPVSTPAPAPTDAPGDIAFPGFVPGVVQPQVFTPYTPPTLEQGLRQAQTPTPLPLQNPTSTTPYTPGSPYTQPGGQAQVPNITDTQTTSPDPCEPTGKPKQKKQRKKREVCHRGTYFETSKGTIKHPKETIKCQ